MTALKDRYLEVWRVGKSFPSKQGMAEIVRDFNLIIKQGEFVSLIGHSGCGKSTVLAMVAGLSEVSGGGIVVAGREIDGAGPDRGVVFQSPNLLPWMTAFQNVLLGVDQVYPDRTRAERGAIVEQYLELVGLGDAMHRRPAQLSQGMRQRVGLARAFALNPKVLLLDEPFGMLDSLTRIDLQDVLIELCARDGKTAIMVTHDVDEALFLSDRVVMMTSGPAATIGEILEVNLPRPRDRSTIYDNPTFQSLRADLIGFLEDGERHASPFAKEKSEDRGSYRTDSSSSAKPQSQNQSSAVHSKVQATHSEFPSPVEAVTVASMLHAGRPGTGVSVVPGLS